MPRATVRSMPRSTAVLPNDLLTPRTAIMSVMVFPSRSELNMA